MSAPAHTPMVVAAARAICRRDSELCNVDFEDNWKFYGDGFLADAQAVLDAVAAQELLTAMQYAREWIIAAGKVGGMNNEATLQRIDAAIAKATGEQA